MEKRLMEKLEMLEKIVNNKIEKVNNKKEKSSVELKAEMDLRLKEIKSLCLEVFNNKTSKKVLKVKKNHNQILMEKMKNMKPRG